jgi:hypothetical protein
MDKPANITIFLPSNANMEEYPENKPQNYTTVLAKPLRLTGRWQMALRDITYPEEKFDVTEESSLKLHYNAPYESMLPLTLTCGAQEIKFMKFFCDTLEDRLRASLIEDDFAKDIVQYPKLWISLEYNTRTRKVTISSTNNGIKAISFHDSNQLPRILGFDIELGREYTLPMQGKYPASASEQRPGFFVYCDVIQPIRVGNEYAQVLAFVPFAKRTAPFKEYINLSFRELESNNVERINISLRDNTGDCIVFPAGQTIVHLELERISATS